MFQSYYYRVWLLFYVPLENFSLICRRYHCRRTFNNLELCLAPLNREQSLSSYPCCEPGPRFLCIHPPLSPFATCKRHGGPLLNRNPTEILSCHYFMSFYWWLYNGDTELYCEDILFVTSVIHVYRPAFTIHKKCCVFLRVVDIIMLWYTLNIIFKNIQDGNPVLKHTYKKQIIIA